MASRSAITVGILVFDGVDELDFVGPLNVFSYSARANGDKDRVVLVGRHRQQLKGVNGLRFLPEFDLSEAPSLDILVVPGGWGTTALLKDHTLLEWIGRQAKAANWIASVCTGSFLLHAAGLTEGKRIATHHGMIEELRRLGAEVVDGQRYIVEGKMVTSAGVSAGIDMALWIVGQVDGSEHARLVQSHLEYHPEPPYRSR